MRRAISAAVVAAGTLALCLLVPPWVREVAILLAAVYACREAVRMAGAITPAPAAAAASEAERIPTSGFVLTVVVMLFLAVLATSTDLVPVVLGAPAVLALFALTLPPNPRSLLWLGAVVLAALWIGLPAAALLGLSSGPEGGRVLLFLLATVMTSEAGAFFGGKLIGGPRLAPSLSPGKTWAGFAAQLAVGAGAGAAAAPLLPAELGPAAAAGLGGWIAAAAALGDLFESFWKRAAGQKDSGRLIPGHGGLLDRVDGVLFGALALTAATVVVPL